MNIRILILLFSMLVVSSLSATENSYSRVYPCSFKDKEQLIKEDGNSELFMELAESTKDLCEFSLQGKVLYSYPLRYLNLHGSNLRSSNFDSSDAQNVMLPWAKLESASFRDSNFKLANFNHTELSGTDLEGANLVGASFYQANLGGANFTNTTFGCIGVNGAKKCTDITGATFHGPSCIYNHDNKDIECDKNKLIFTDIKGAKNIKSLVYDYSSHLNFPPTLITLRKHLRDNGFEREAREITYVIQRGFDEEVFSSSSKDSYLELFGAILRRVAFDYSVQYGASASNALVLLFYTLIVFSLIYLVMLSINVKFYTNRLGDILLIIPKIESPGRLAIKEFEDGSFSCQSVLKEVNQYSEKLPPYGPDRRLDLKHRVIIFKHSLWFSILSSFHFGWRDLNVGNWLARLQPKPFTYRPTGVFRFFSGVQSLICIYLLAIFVLSYFGTPWG